jgi:hypothetical protein
MRSQPAPLKSAEVIARHDGALSRVGWPHDESHATEAGDEASIWRWLMANHRFNSLLWMEEDLARRTTVGGNEIAANKRAIDRYNQGRNDAIERLDELLLVGLGLIEVSSARTIAPSSRAATGARLNSETAGAMIDRLSILALKIAAMRRQTLREDVDDAHRETSRARLERLQEQRSDLAGCLDALLADCVAGRAYFKVYRQFKMYNDPRFNPTLVAEHRARTG